MDIVSETLKQGGLAVLAGVFLWAWIDERKSHNLTRKEKDAMAEARRTDAVESKDQAYEILSSNTAALQLIGAKIETVQTPAKRRR